MKFKDSTEINHRMRVFNEAAVINARIAEYICMPIENNSITFNAQSLRMNAKQFAKNMAKAGVSYSSSESLMAMFIMGLLSGSNEKVNLPNNVIHRIIKSTRRFHPADILSNEYFDGIDFGNTKKGRCELCHDTFKANELFMYNTPVMSDGIMIPQIGSFSDEFTYPVIKENYAAWMSVTPNEIFTMNKPISKAKGKVITFGLGMGYFAFMAALKDNVQSVTIIENEPDMISLFNDVILPQFPDPGKIHIIQADAYEYAEKLKDKEFDYCFVDIFRDNLDYLPYLRIKDIIENRLRKTPVDYWIEDSLMVTLSRFIWCVMYDEWSKYHEKDATPELEELKANLVINDNKQVIPLIRERFSKVTISRPDYISYYMDYRNIRAVL